MSPPNADSVIDKDKPPPRPAMPSGTVRTRRMTRHRKNKARTETSLEPAVPEPALPECRARSAPKKGTAPAVAPPPSTPVPPPQTPIHVQHAAGPAEEDVRVPPGLAPGRVPSSTQTPVPVHGKTSALACAPEAPEQQVPQGLRAAPQRPQGGSQAQMLGVRQVQKAGQPPGRGQGVLQQETSLGRQGLADAMGQQGRGHRGEMQNSSRTASQAVGHVRFQVPAQKQGDVRVGQGVAVPVKLQDRGGMHSPLRMKKVMEHVPATPRPLQAVQNHLNFQVPASERLIVDVSPQSQHSSKCSDENNENTVSDSDTAARVDPETIKMQSLIASASAIKAPGDGYRPRPLICQDITNSNADTLRISRLPRGVTYDRILNMVEPFGEVEDLAWTASDPYVCDVTYRDPAAAREAKHFLGDALVGSDSEPALKAELRSRDPGAQLFVGDLTPDVTEEMLEATFSELVGEPVSALLKRDPDSFSPIGYGFLSFQNESSANFALVAGHRTKVGNASVRVGRAERNTHLYVSDLAPEVSLEELKNVFGRFGTLVDEDTLIVRRSYAFVRYKNRGAAEKAKRTLDKTDLKGRLSVRYAEAEPLKACVAVQFHSSVPRPPNSLGDLLSATFSKHGNCSVEIPRLQNGMWRKVAFVTYHGEPITANLAALEAVQSVRFVSSLPVCCQFARELIPRLPSRGLRLEKLGDFNADQTLGPFSDRKTTRGYLSRKPSLRRGDQPGESGGSQARQGQHTFKPTGGTFANENGTQQGAPDFVPIYVPVTALHPSQIAGNAGLGVEGDMSRFQQQWQNRMLINNTSGAPLHPGASSFSPNYNSYAPMQDRMMRW